MTEKAHSSLGGINVVPDEDNKKLLKALGDSFWRSGDTKEARWQEEYHRCCKELIGTHRNCLPLRKAWKKTRCDPDYFKKQTAQV